MIRSLTHWLTYLTVVLLSAAGWHAANAQPQLSEDCADGQRKLFYARVDTETDPLLIRSAPNGRIIGAVPKGWEVVVSERDPSGLWARIGNHWSHWDNQLSGGSMGGAPDFTIGWVSTEYLTNLGEFCEKPSMTSRLEPLDTTSGQQNLLVQEDWLALGDRLAQNL